MHSTRRQFLKTSALGAAAAAVPRFSARAANPAVLSKRQFGSKPEELSLIGFGGIVVKDADQDHANRVVSEFVLEEQKQGRIKYLGFSAHSVAAALAALNRHEFDSVLFPVNFAAWMEGDFGPQILKLAHERGAARLALKAMARSRWTEGDPFRKEFKKCWYRPLSDPHEAELGLRFTLSQPVTAAIPPGDEGLFRLAVDLAMKFQPIDDKGEAELAALAKEVRLIFPA